jgi:hypothetical protein
MKLTGRRCLCRSCGEYFSSVASFDKHRTGPATDRRCLPPAEAGLVKNEGGWWVTERMPTLSTPRWKVARGSGVSLEGAISSREGLGQGSGDRGQKPRFSGLPR